jgi:hypothetical protein
MTIVTYIILGLLYWVAFKRLYEDYNPVFAEYSQAINLNDKILAKIQPFN